MPANPAANVGLPSISGNNNYDNATDVSDAIANATPGANANGGVLNVTKGVYAMNGGTISGVKGATNGGAIYVGGGATFILNGGTIENCSAECGGAIFVETGSTLVIKSGSINNCSAINGGAIYLQDGAKMVAYGGTINSCNVTGYGGGIYIGNASADLQNLSILKCDSTSTNDNGGGGGISLISGNLTLTDCNMSGNHSVQAGGAIRCYPIYDENEKKCSVIIYGGKFNNNSTDGYAGVIDSYGTLTINGGQFKENTAVYGGGAISQGENQKYAMQITIAGGEFIGNEVTGHSGGLAGGGAMIIHHGNIYNTLIQGNIVNGQGGAISSTGVLNLTNVTLKDNESNGSDGGAIYNSYTVTMDNCIFDNNRAPNNSGGAIFMEAGSTCTIYSGEFTNNSCKDFGGAICFKSCNGNVLGGTFTNNSGGYGGAISFITHTAGYILRSSYSGNSSSIIGPTIYLGDYANLVYTNLTSLNSWDIIVENSDCIVNKVTKN